MTAKRSWSAALLVFAGSLAVSACAVPSSGLHSQGFITASAAASYIPLEGSAYVVFDAIGAGTVIAPGLAVTNAHNDNLLAPQDIVARSANYDLLFFRTARAGVPPLAEPRMGTTVVAYGHGVHGDVREARGIVRALQSPVLPLCPTCATQVAFVFQAEGGEGFSGGPVFDVETGQLVGITFGFRDGVDDKHPNQRLMYAYDMKRVFEELKAAHPGAAP